MREEKVCNRALDVNMDSALDAHFHKIDSSNFIEYKAPHPSKVKYAPPSPTTSGYSESGSEMDNHDSGRVSEMEGSPKMHLKRPNIISLSMEVFNPGDGQMTSPDPFPEGKTTIKSNVTRSSDGGETSQRANSVTISALTLRTLILSLRDAHCRLDSVETKVDALIKVLQLQNIHSTSAMMKLSKAVLALGKDFRKYTASSHGPQNGRIPSKFQSSIPDPVRRHRVPISCNNNNTSCSDDSRKFQSYDCLQSRSPRSLPRTLSPDSDYQMATFPRFLRTDALSPLSVAPPNETTPENYDNVQTSDSSSEGEKIKHDGVTNASSHVTSHKSPVYAVLKKKENSTDKMATVTEQHPPDLPRRSLEMLTPLNLDVDPRLRSQSLMTSPSDDVENLQKGPSEEDLEDMIREIRESTTSDAFRNDVSRDGSLRRTSRFSEMESLLSVFDNSTVFSEDTSPSGEFVALGPAEGYENTGHSQNDYFEEDIFSMEPIRKKGTDNQSPNSLTHALQTDKEKRESAREGNDASWHAREHELTYSNAPTVQRATCVPKKNSPPHLKGAKQASQSAVVSKSLSSIESQVAEGLEQGAKRGKKKPHSSDSKKENALVSNYNKLFKRKNKKKRTVSEDSFTFVTSPLHEAHIEPNLGRIQTSDRLGRGVSVESALSEETSQRPTISSVSNLSSSREGSVFVGYSQGDINSSSEDKRRALTSVQSPSNTQLLRLQSREALFADCEVSSAGEFDNVERWSEIDEENYDNLKAEEMRPNLIKLAKKAFRISPKIRKKGKSSPHVQTAELKPKLPNGHAVKHDPLPPIPTEIERKEIIPTEVDEKDVIPTDGSPTFVRTTPDNVIADDVFIPPGTILDRLQREQADRIRFETDRTGSLDEPPRKPNRPGFTHGGLQGGPVSSVGPHANGGVPGYHRGMPALPTKKIMTPEELTNYDAQDKLRRKQDEEERLQQTLDHQQKQSVENARWLEKEEFNLSPEIPASGGEPALTRGRGSSNSLTDMRGPMEAPPPPNVAPSKPPRKSSRPKEEPAGPPQTKLEEVKTAPTMQLNRDDDDVYKETMEVVKSVLGMNNMTMDAKPDELFASVKTVGAALKQLCASLEKTLPELPEDFHREIDMAQRTTNKDLSQVINQLKLVQRFYNTTQVVDYKKCLMAANQVLAIDAKNLLDVVDRARIRKIQTAQEKAKAQTEDIRRGVSQTAPAGYEPEELYPDGDFL